MAATITAEQACAALSGRTVGDATLTTVVVAANGDMPRYCKVSGLIAPSLNFELRLPDQWNGKLYYGGGGGYNGTIPPPVARPLTQGYAEVASDSGHQGVGSSAAFAAGNDRAVELFGSKAVPMVTAAVVRVLQTAYGAPPVRRYFEGCSTGGREALMAVQRDPELFDGVVARAPAYNMTAVMGEFNRVAQALAAPGGAFSPAKTALLAAHVRKACDALDGVADGIVSNPAACTPARVNVTALRCAGGRDGGNVCLSDPQLAVVRAWTTDGSWGGGAYVTRGYNLTGNEDAPFNFNDWAAGHGDVRTAGQYGISDSTVKYLLSGDPTTDSLTYKPFDQNRVAMVRMARLIDATNADIRPFLSRGGKLILWHGGADSGLSVNSTIDYVGRMRRVVGAARADASTRFYTPPGVNHCEGGVGADDTDLLSAVDRWVTTGVAPGTLQAVKRDKNGQVTMSRPLCQFPGYPRYVGPAGNAAAASLSNNYVCTMPASAVRARD